MTFEVYKSPKANLGESWIKLKGFKIESRKNAISNATELEEIGVKLGIPSIPEMFYGRNSLTLTYEDMMIIDFNAVDALAMVDLSREGSSSLKVSMAHKWTNKNEKEVDIIQEAIKPYDWTFTTHYSGTCPPDTAISDTVDRVDIQKLSLPEPILFYDEVILYEDELGDNGTGILSVKVRVMPSCFLILLRFFLRVDGVLIRFVDTRLFHDFSRPISEGLVREFQVREIEFKQVVARLPITANGPDYSQLHNVNWISTLMTEETVKMSRFEKISTKKVVQ